MKTVLESLGMVCVNPEVMVRLEGGTVADTVATLGLASETLRRAIVVLTQHDPHGEQEDLAELRSVLLVQLEGTAAAALGLVEICRSQGVRFAEKHSYTRVN